MTGLLTLSLLVAMVYAILRERKAQTVKIESRQRPDPEEARRRHH
jgi:hypothetical protein